jgi:hypothetical protein
MLIPMVVSTRKFEINPGTSAVELRYRRWLPWSDQGTTATIPQINEIQFYKLQENRLAGLGSSRANAFGLGSSP